MNRFLLPILSLLLIFLFPNLGKCQDMANQQNLPKSNSDLELLLNNSSQELPLKLGETLREIFSSKLLKL